MWEPRVIEGMRKIKEVITIIVIISVTVTITVIKIINNIIVINIIATDYCCIYYFYHYYYHRLNSNIHFTRYRLCGNRSNVGNGECLATSRINSGCE